MIALLVSFVLQLSVVHAEEPDCNSLAASPAAAVDPLDAILAEIGPHRIELRKYLIDDPNNLIWRPWRKALAVLPEIQKALQSVDADERPYFQRIVNAIEAALTKHQLEYLREKRPGQALDFPRHLAILTAIADFDPAKPKFSLYRIKRVIEDRHSLTEYIECK